MMMMKVRDVGEDLEISWRLGEQPPSRDWALQQLRLHARRRRQYWHGCACLSEALMLGLLGTFVFSGDVLVLVPLALLTCIRQREMRSVRTWEALL